MTTRAQAAEPAGAGGRPQQDGDPQHEPRACRSCAWNGTSQPRKARPESVPGLKSAFSRDDGQMAENHAETLGLSHRHRSANSDLTSLGGHYKKDKQKLTSTDAHTAASGTADGNVDATATCRTAGRTLRTSHRPPRDLGPPRRTKGGACRGAHAAPSLPSPVTSRRSNQCPPLDSG